MLTQFDSNNDSLAEIPSQVLSGLWDGKSKLQSWRRLHFRMDNLSPGYDIQLLCDWHPDDGRKLDLSKTSMRASVTNIWNGSDKLIVFKPGCSEPLKPIEKRQACGHFNARILRLTGWKSLRNKTVRIYRLNHMFTFPDSFVKGLDCHHISKDNSILRFRCRKEGITLGDEWFKASDDRILNQALITPEEHWFKHEFKKDAGYYGNFRLL